MKKAKAKIPSISEEELSIDEFFGYNGFGPHADLKPGEFRNIKNLDIYRGYIKTRKGSAKLPQVAACPDYNILNHAVYDSGDTEYLIIQQATANPNESAFLYVQLTDDGSSKNWKNIYYKDSFTPFTIATTDRADLYVINNKIYVFSVKGNSIFEFEDAVFSRRRMGLPAPQITSVTQYSSPGVVRGKHVYGVELVYKKTFNLYPDADIIVSGPNRAMKLDNPSFGEGKFAYVEGEYSSWTVKVSPVLNDGTLITDDVNDFWTHARLYRSKDMTATTNDVPDMTGESEITGRDDELFRVQEMDKDTFLDTLSEGFYSFALDNVADDEMPFPKALITGGRLDMVPVPQGETSVFHRNRIWVAGVTELPGPAGASQQDSTYSKIFYTPESDTIYSESMNVLNAIEADPGDGQRMVKLLPLGDDLLGLKESKTGRVPNGNPDAGWITEDPVIGIEDKEYAQFVPKLGICAIVNDQKDFKIFGFNLEWTNLFAGMEVSKPVRNLIKSFTPDDIDFMYMNGKLFINSGKTDMLVLSAEERRGWTRYNYKTNDKMEAVFSFDSGTRAAIANGGRVIVEIETDDITDYDLKTGQDVPMEWELETHKWQSHKGRDIVQQRFISMMADLVSNLSMQPYVNGRIWDVPFNLLLAPTDYPLDELKETEYQGYSEISPLGNYLHYTIEGNEPATIYSILLNCLIQRGSILPGFDPFQVLEMATTIPPWASVTVFFKDAGDENRDSADYEFYDAGDEDRDNADYTFDDAGNEDRSS